MNNLANVVIILARCTRTGLSFGIRCEEKLEKTWTLTWAFAIKEKAAKREGYDQAEIMGDFLMDHAYPGCPHCSIAKGFFQCSCGKVGCWDQESQVVKCPWCHQQIVLGGEVNSIQAGNDY